MSEQRDTSRHYHKIRAILIWILVLNWAVALAKIFYGLLTKCESMAADGFHSLSDGTSNVICLIGIHFAGQPIDKDHPYGHKKYETLFSLAIAALLFIVCFNLVKEGIGRIQHPVIPQINLASFTIMLATLAVNFGVMRYEFKKGRLLKSDILISDSLHTKADIFTSLSVITGLIVMKINPALAIVDPIVTLLISIFIARAGIEIIKESSSVLCDTAVILDDKQISDIVLSIKGVESCHKIRTRGRNDDIHIDLHVEVDRHMPIEDAHKISYRIEEALRNRLPGATDIVVHMEPRE